MGGREGLVERLWWRIAEPAGTRALLSPLLVPEALFRAGVALRGALHDRGALPVARAARPVVSVGNLAVGGAGKTPVTLAIAQRLQARGRRPAILSRGYGATVAEARVVSDGRQVLLDAAAGGDEPVLAARRLPGVPVLCAPDRAALAERAIALGADVLLLDDGFQHRRLGRDLDVVVLDATNPFGNGHLLPRGPNREPPSALRRAGLAWLAQADRAGEEALAGLRALARKFTGREPVESRAAPCDLRDASLERAFPLEALSGRRVGLLTGVARPGRVRRTVEDLGGAVVATRAFPDHHRFTAAEVEEALAATRAAGGDWLVTTEKDAVRLPSALGAAAADRIRAVRIDVEILKGAASLDEALDVALAAGRGRPGEGEGGQR